VLPPGHVNDRIEGGHRAESMRGELHVGHVSADEASAGDELSGAMDLDIGEVHPRNPKPGGKDPGHRNAGPRSQVENFGPGLELTQDRRQPPSVRSLRVAEAVRRIARGAVSVRDPVPPRSNDLPKGVSGTSPVGHGIHGHS